MTYQGGGSSLTLNSVSGIGDSGNASLLTIITALVLIVWSNCWCFSPGLVWYSTTEPYCIHLGGLVTNLAFFSCHWEIISSILSMSLEALFLIQMQMMYSPAYWDLWHTFFSVHTKWRKLIQVPTARQFGFSAHLRVVGLNSSHRFQWAFMNTDGYYNQSLNE